MPPKQVVHHTTENWSKQNATTMRKNVNGFATNVLRQLFQGGQVGYIAGLVYR